MNKNYLFFFLDFVVFFSGFSSFGCSSTGSSCGFGSSFLAGAGCSSFAGATCSYFLGSSATRVFSSFPAM
ncbi:MAG: hypothetical protein SOV27_04890 [Eubacteriales bacterium]|nr:hypothetical protein [Eubacteriales bacterium]